MSLPTLGRPLPPDVALDTKVAVFRDNGTVLHGRTRSKIENIAPAGWPPTPVIFVTGISGYYKADRVRIDVDPRVAAWHCP